MTFRLNTTIVILVCALMSIPITANAQIFGGQTTGDQTLEEQLEKTIELVKKIITNIDSYNQTTTLDENTSGLDQQSKKYGERYVTVIDTCNDNLGNSQMVVLCDKVKQSFNQHMKQFFIENNSTIQQIILHQFSGLVK